MVYGNGNVLGYDRVGRELVVNAEQVCFVSKNSSGIFIIRYTYVGIREWMGQWNTLITAKIKSGQAAIKQAK